ncbi:MAG: sigma-54-dependent Fis family transcriptional regulator [Deltaproteobacteria bacterium]|nr:sigma-54-dependent Fis family transcriptional regulator [Deltaproteobacteria bacterium]
MNKVISIIDDDRQFARAVSRNLHRENYRTTMAYSAEDAREMIERVQPDVVLMDLNLPDADGGELAAELTRIASSTKFIIITGHGSISSAVKNLNNKNVVNYLTKPCDTKDLLKAIHHACELGKSAETHTDSKKRAHSAPRPSDIVFRSAPMRRVISIANRVAIRDTPVLLRGESGAGKDWIASWIHYNSPRKDKDFFTINCAALTKELVESELFGHESGSFTGNKGLKRGMLELANGGTVLLNEIGEMDLTLQAKLLTFLDTLSFIRVGGERSIKIDVRIFAATNQDLEKMVKEGRFRQDLYYRLNVLSVNVPPLRERAEDIPALAASLLHHMSASENIDAPVLEKDAEALLKAYSWPGNIRELRNVLARAMMYMENGFIKKSDLDLGNQKENFNVNVTFPCGQGLQDIIQDVSRQIISEAIRVSNTKQEAAVMLGITRHALTYQMKTLGLS